jgi:hypothetical protein
MAESNHPMTGLSSLAVHRHSDEKALEVSRARKLLFHVNPNKTHQIEFCSQWTYSPSQLAILIISRTKTSLHRSLTIELIFNLYSEKIRAIRVETNFGFY